MSNRPRTPRHFPRMKVRGKGRRKSPWAEWARFAAAVSAAAVAFAGFGEIAKAAVQFEEAYARVQALTDATNAQMAEIVLSAQGTAPSPSDAINAFGMKYSKGGSQ